MKNTFLLLSLTALAFFEPPFGGLGAFAQPLPIVATVPAEYDTQGMYPDELRMVPLAFSVDVPLGSGTVKVRMLTEQGGDLLHVRDFPLGTQTWPDSSYVMPTATGHRIGIGRFTGIDAFYLQVLSGGSVIGSGSWERP